MPASLRDRALRAYLELRARALDAEGQTASEYMGILLVAAILVAAIAKSGIAGEIHDKVADLIDAISGGSSPSGH